MEKLILASQSKRRQDLLKNAGFTFDIMVPDVDESLVLGANLSPDETVSILAGIKAEAVLGLVCSSAVIIAADTVVVHHGQIIGKPKDKADAAAILKRLSADKHFIYTAVSIIQKGNTVSSCNILEKASVYMNLMTDDEINQYIQTGQTMDKAGGYGIQGIGGLFIDRIEGDFFAIEGLPISKVYRELKKLGIRPDFTDLDYI